MDTPRLFKKMVKRLIPARRKYRTNTTTNYSMLGGLATPFNPTPSFIYGFKGPNESVEEIIKSDENLLRELKVTHEELATLIDEVFATDDDVFCGCPLIRWTNIHSPICPFGDFCTKSIFDYQPQVTEIWLCDPDHWEEIQAWYHSFTTNGYPINDLKRFVDLKWVIVFSDLHPHLIRAHHFFEGHETPYRVDPRLLARMLPR